MFFARSAIGFVQEDKIFDVVGQDRTPLDHRKRELLDVNQAGTTPVCDMDNIVAPVAKNFAKQRPHILIQKE